MAKKENQADIIGGLNINTNGDKFLTQTLLDLSQTGTINESNKVANYLLNGLKSINTLHKNNVEKAKPIIRWSNAKGCNSKGAFI